MSVCLLTLGGCLINYLERQNTLTQLRLYVPKLSLEIKGIQEEISQLKYNIQEFENPDHLLKLASDFSSGYLKHPLEKEILVIQERNSLQSLGAEEEFPALKSNHTLAAGN